MTAPTRFTLDEPRAKAILTALIAAGTRELTPDEATLTAPYSYDQENPDQAIDWDLDGWDPINDPNLTTLWETVRAFHATGVITGPAVPEVDVDDDGSEAHYRWTVPLSEYRSVLAAGEWTAWKYLLVGRDGGDDGAVEGLLNAMRLMVSDLNVALDEYDRHLDAVLATRTRDLTISPGHLGINIDGRTVATLPLPGPAYDAAGSFLVTLDDEHGNALAGWDVHATHIEVGTWWHAGSLRAVYPFVGEM